MSLLDDLRQVAVSPSELPNNHEALTTLGALLKVLDSAGLKVAEDLIPAPIEQDLTPVAQAAAPEIEKLVAAELARLGIGTTTTPATPAPTPTPVVETPAPVTPAPSFLTPPIETLATEVPAAPPIEGAS
jgi:hypothetical protein